MCGPAVRAVHLRADEVESSSHDVGAGGLLGHHQQHVLRHRLAQLVEELAGQVRRAPLAICSPQQEARHQSKDNEKVQ